MFSFDAFINLPMIWGGLVATAVLMYVLLDGFDLGVGILFPFAPSDTCRNRMMNSIAPFWDGNETWLVLGAGGLFVAFPPAYGVVMSAFYIPVILMLLCLIMRGVSLELRYKSEGRDRFVWDAVFHFGSLGAAFCQGLILGGFVTGVEVDPATRQFAGDPYAWLSAFSVMTGLAVIFGYALLGATWTVVRTDGPTEQWARQVAGYVLFFVGLGMLLVSLAMPMMHDQIAERWFSMPNMLLLAPIPLLSLCCFAGIWHSLFKGYTYRPFLLSTLLFFLAFVGLGISIWPYAVPFGFTLEAAAARPESLSLLLVGALIMLPVVLGYTAFCYKLFWGKVGHEQP